MIQDALELFLGVAFLAGLALALMNYFRNKQSDRGRHRRERLEEKQEELMESLRKKKNSDEN